MPRACRFLFSATRFIRHFVMKKITYTTAEADANSLPTVMEQVKKQ
jgi:hypothetical protein